jgi:hypothetical protein
MTVSTGIFVTESKGFKGFKDFKGFKASGDIKRADTLYRNPNKLSQAWESPNGNPNKLSQTWESPNGNPNILSQIWESPNGNPDIFSQTGESNKQQIINCLTAKK